MVWCYVFIVKYEMEVQGAGMAMTLTSFLMWLTVTIISYRIPRIQEALFFPTAESLQDWQEYFAISIPATIMICASWWGFELYVILSAYLGTDQMATMAISQNIAILVYMVPAGFQEPVCSMVGS